MLPRELFEKGLIWAAETTAADKGAAVPASTTSSQALKSVPFGVDEIDSLLPHCGLARGGIHEFFPISEKAAAGSSLYTIPAIVAAHAHRPLSHCAWIGKECWPTPFLLEQIKKGLSDAALFADDESLNKKLLATESALRAPGMAAVVAGCKQLRFATTRRLALAAEEGQTIGIIVRAKTGLATPSCALSRWLIAPEKSPTEFPRWKLSLISCKGQQPPISEWVVELAGHETLSLRIPSGLAERPQERRNAGGRHAA